MPLPDRGSKAVAASPTTIHRSNAVQDRQELLAATTRRLEFHSHAKTRCRVYEACESCFIQFSGEEILSTRSRSPSVKNPKTNCLCGSNAEYHQPSSVASINVR